MPKMQIGKIGKQSPLNGAKNHSEIRPLDWIGISALLAASVGVAAYDLLQGAGSGLL